MRSPIMNFRGGQADREGGEKRKGEKEEGELVSRTPHSTRTVLLVMTIHYAHNVIHSKDTLAKGGTGTPSRNEWLVSS